MYKNCKSGLCGVAVFALGCVTLGMSHCVFVKSARYATGPDPACNLVVSDNRFILSDANKSMWEQIDDQTIRTSCAAPNARDKGDMRNCITCFLFADGGMRQQLPDGASVGFDYTGTVVECPHQGYNPVYKTYTFFDGYEEVKLELFLAPTVHERIVINETSPTGVDVESQTLLGQAGSAGEGCGNKLVTAGAAFGTALVGAVSTAVIKSIVVK